MKRKLDRFINRCYVAFFIVAPITFVGGMASVGFGFHPSWVWWIPTGAILIVMAGATAWYIALPYERNLEGRE